MFDLYYKWGINHYLKADMIQNYQNENPEKNKNNRQKALESYKLAIKIMKNLKLEETLI